ncbi:MAG: bifunctional (p)ppGpp synthetase/guanosine-3',5'-bis(diphosphate) 3'-pyrophosphohydrolase [Patescibacteria group bacterium]|nr:bifunctional (p)ppGpp synthetase/guanosine-3',5'-bis(diphosphate) 3'-pyrophosphohydrolase [Patescibacteria group bacterium]
MFKDFYEGVDIPSDFDKELVSRAFRFAKVAHRGQKRRSGDDYITHPLAVGKILLDLGMSAEMVAAAFLHDVVEDTDIKIEEIKDKFGLDVANLVAGVTALKQIDFSTYSKPEEAEEAKNQAKNENLRQLFLSMAEDVRVVVIKLADRLHNMETIKSLSPKDQKRISLETLNIFAPLALRLGMGEIKGRLEDLAFPIAFPKEYKFLKKEANRRYKEADRYTLKVKREIEDELKSANISAKVEGRAKHIYSLYKKITRPEIDWDFDKVYDLVALRIITESESDCYKIMGLIHGKYRPIPNYVRDYIAAPKPNGYRSIHTTIFGPEGKICEIQIRTHEMHEEAEYGVASHLHYTLEKSSGKSDKDLERGTFAKSNQTEFLKRIKEWQTSIGDAGDFLEGLKMEFLDERIYVFSPNGDIFDLPVDSTPIDFAYEVHSKIGDSCVGSKINGKIASLDTRLRTRDVVEIITSKGGTPKRGWLDFVKTSKARQHIRGYFRKFDFDKNVLEGKEIVFEELGLLGYNIDDFSEKEIKSSISETSFKTVNDLYASVGEGLTTKRQAAKILVGRTIRPLDFKKSTQSLTRSQKIDKYDVRGLKINLAPCCQPNRGDETISYITRGRGLTVHKVGCPNIKNLEKKRLVDYDPWRKDGDLVSIRIIADNRVGLIRDISGLISEKNVNIEKIENKKVVESEKTEVLIKIKLIDFTTFSDIIHGILKIEGVDSVKRSE